MFATYKYVHYSNKATNCFCNMMHIHCVRNNFTCTAKYGQLRHYNVAFEHNPGFVEKVASKCRHSHGADWPVTMLSQMLVNGFSCIYAIRV